MITITLQFQDPQSVDATLLAALGELPAKLSFQLISMIHQQVNAQLAPQVVTTEPPAAAPAEAAALEPEPVIN